MFYFHGKWCFKCDSDYESACTSSKYGWFKQTIIYKNSGSRTVVFHKKTRKYKLYEFLGKSGFGGETEVEGGVTGACRNDCGRAEACGPQELGWRVPLDLGVPHGPRGVDERTLFCKVAELWVWGLTRDVYNSVMQWCVCWVEGSFSQRPVC